MNSVFSDFAGFRAESGFCRTAEKKRKEKKLRNTQDKSKEKTRFEFV